jgi:hypothetical protein
MTEGTRAEPRTFDVRRYLAEAIGTFALVAVGPGAVMVSASTHAFGHTGVALAFGLVITFVVAATGHLGGAHINPAVTIAFWSVRRFPAREVVPYVLAQCVGATAAAFTLGWLLGPVGGYGATVPTLSLGRAFVVEFGTPLSSRSSSWASRRTSARPPESRRSRLEPPCLPARWSLARSPVALSTRPAVSALR